MKVLKIPIVSNEFSRHFYSKNDQFCQNKRLNILREICNQLGLSFPQNDLVNLFKVNIFNHIYDKILAELESRLEDFTV